MTEAQHDDSTSQDGPVVEDEFVAEDDSIIGKVFSRSIMAMAGIALIVCVVVWSVNRPEEAPPATDSVVAAPKRVEDDTPPPVVAFTDITVSAGIDFVHESGAAGEKLMPETMGSGAAFFDYDNDGDQDLLLMNGQRWLGDAQEASAATQALYRNDGSGRFENVTTETGLDMSLYATGAAVGDYDNDGDVDVFLAALGSNRLLRNNGGRFEDVTASANVAGGDSEWSTSSAFVDYENDGDLDLFVCNYIRWSREIDFEVDYKLVGVGRAYGPPMNFAGTFPYLYRNNGDGTFTDVSADAGVQVKNPATGAAMAKSLGVAPVDADRDGWMDLLVSNDTVANFYFHNNGDGTFSEDAVVVGLAYDRDGNATGAMGIDTGQHRNDGDLGVAIGNFANEMTSLYVSQGRRSLFADEAIVEGIGAPSRLMLSFGLFLFDYDLDRRLDLLQANGHLEEEINIVQPSQNYEQPAQLFWNCGPGRRRCFVPVDPTSTADFAEPMVGRGATYADIDNDGDLDVLFTQVGRRPILFRNDFDAGHHWIRLKLIGVTCNRDAIGAWIETEVEGDHIARQVMPTRSYLSQVELPVTIGLGESAVPVSITISWPGGGEQTVENLAVDRTHVIRQSVDGGGAS